MEETCVFDDLKYPQWQEPCAEAIVEARHELVADKIAKARTAVFLRLQELSYSSANHEEREAVNQALRFLRERENNVDGIADWRSW